MEKNNLKFERFTSIGGHFSYYISLNRVGGFSFSAGFCKKINIKQFPYIILYYDRKTKAVGFSFLKEAEKGTFKLSIYGNKTASVRPNSFIAAYEIKPEIFAGRYEPKEYQTEEGEKIFYIILQEKKISGV